MFHLLLYLHSGHRFGLGHVFRTLIGSVSVCVIPCLGLSVFSFVSHPPSYASPPVHLVPRLVSSPELARNYLSLYLSLSLYLHPISVVAFLVSLLPFVCSLPTASSNICDDAPCQSSSSLVLQASRQGRKTSLAIKMSLPLRPLRATDSRTLSGSPSPLVRRRRSTRPVEVGRGKGRIQRLCADLMDQSKNESRRYARRRVRAANEGSGHRGAERGTNRARPGPRCVLVGRQPPARFLLLLERGLVVGARRRTRAGRW